MAAADLIKRWTVNPKSRQGRTQATDGGSNSSSSRRCGDRGSDYEREAKKQK